MTTTPFDTTNNCFLQFLANSQAAFLPETAPSPRWCEGIYHNVRSQLQASFPIATNRQNEHRPEFWILTKILSLKVARLHFQPSLLERRRRDISRLSSIELAQNLIDPRAESSPRQAKVLDAANEQT
jgi:hypothetical protein